MRRERGLEDWEQHAAAAALSVSRWKPNHGFAVPGLGKQTSDAGKLCTGLQEPGRDTGSHGVRAAEGNLLLTAVHLGLP